MKTYIANTKRNGKGVFVSEHIPKGNLIFIVEGTLKQEPYDIEHYLKELPWTNRVKNRFS